MVRTRHEPIDVESRVHRETIGGSHGVVVKQQLIALGLGRATGTFQAIGAIDGTGKASSDSLVGPAPTSARPVHLEGDVLMCAPAGTLVVRVSAVARLVPGTGVLTGGGTWTLSEANGAFDGLRASGASTLLVVYAADGTVTIDVILTGHVVTTPGGPGDHIG